MSRAAAGGLCVHDLDYRADARDARWRHRRPARRRALAVDERRRPRWSARSRAGGRRAAAAARDVARPGPGVARPDRSDGRAAQRDAEVRRSATLGSADEWDHTTIVGYDDIAGLREREQLLTYGCGRLARDLLADGLLDVLVLSLTPVVAGAGRRL